MLQMADFGSARSAVGELLSGPITTPAASTIVASASRNQPTVRLPDTEMAPPGDMPSPHPNRTHIHHSLSMLRVSQAEAPTAAARQIGGDTGKDGAGVAAGGGGLQLGERGGWVTPLTRVVCTPCYRAPEVVMSRGGYSSAMDM